MKSASKLSTLFRQNGFGELLSKFVPAKSVKQHKLLHFCCQERLYVTITSSDKVSANLDKLNAICSKLPGAGCTKGGLVIFSTVVKMLEKL